ncbi:MAG: hypothetical protein ACOYM3_13190 [Terrimicrobiaceae bacterium]
MHIFRIPCKSITCHRILALLTGFLIFTETSRAGERRFTYVYEATTAAKGEIEIENWVTWKSQRESGGQGNTYDFRHEIEFGLTDKLQLGIYVADWRVRDQVAGGEDGAQAIYQDSAVEVIYNLSNPVTDFIGSAVYGEVKLGDQKFELEGKLILQKNFGPFVLAYNATLEAEWEGERFGYFNERSGTFEQTLGVSYQLSPQFLVGGEFLHEIGFSDWAETGDSIVYAGPNASFRYDRFYVTTTALIQTTGVSDEPDFQLRTIFGIHF